LDRNKKIVGFIGMDKYEYILYLSRILYHLKKNVLLVDCSETGALTASIPIPKGATDTVIETRGIMFLDGRSSFENHSFCWEEAPINEKEYDYVLIDYGYNTNADGLRNCDQLVIVTDQLAHNLGRLSIPDFLKDKEKTLIIKHVVSCKITPEYIAKELDFDHPFTKKVYVVYEDELDRECKIKCQYEGVFRFIKISMQLKSVIKGLTIELLPKLTKKELKVAYKKAERGV
jgi:hypothetical protein